MPRDSRSPLPVFLLLISFVGACTHTNGSRPTATEELASGARPGCCDDFERTLDAYLREQHAASLPTLETKIAWVARHRPAYAPVLGELALEQIRSRSPDPSTTYDAIVIGGGPLSAVIGCNLQRVESGTGCGVGRPPRVLVIARFLGGPFAHFGRAFYLNTPEVEPDPDKSINRLPGCSVQLHTFLVGVDGSPFSYSARNAKTADLEGRTQYYAEARVLGDVTLLNHMLSGADFLLSEDVPERAVRQTWDGGEAFVDVTVAGRVFRTRRLVVATGHGEPIVPAGMQELLTAEASQADPRIETLDAFFRRVHVDPGSPTTRLQHYERTRVGIAGGNDGASSLADFFLGAAPASAYGEPRPSVPPARPDGLQLFQFGQRATTGAEFRAKLAPYKALRYAEVANAIDDGRLKTGQAHVARAVSRADGALDVALDTGEIVVLDRLLLATGYDANGAYRLFSPDTCPAEVRYDSLRAPPGAGIATPIAQVPFCGDTLLAGVYLFVPAGLSSDPNMRSLRHLTPAAAALGRQLAQTLP